MKILSNINWLERVSELFVIVLGVLIAFALNSWWETRQEGDREEIYLAQLKIDFEKNEKDLKGIIKGEKRMQEDIRAIIELFNSPPDEKAARTLAKHLPYVLSFTRFTPITETYGSLVHTGEINLLRSEDLKRSLVSFANNWAMVQHELLRLGDSIYQAISRPVAKEFILAEARILKPELQLNPPKEIRDKINYTGLLTDRRFNKFMADIWSASEMRILAYEILLEDLKRVSVDLSKES